MRGFHFRLQPLLTVRQATRDEQRTELARAQVAQRLAFEQRKAVQDTLAAEHDRVRANAASGPLDVGRLARSSRYAATLRARLEELLAEERAAAARVERTRDALIEADRGVRVLEKLRERQLEQFDREQRAAETKQLDEIAARAVGDRAA